MGIESGRTTIVEEDRTVAKDLATLARFIAIYCEHRHLDVSKKAPRIRGFDFDKLKIPRKPLCGACAKLLGHAFVKRAYCPFSPKPACKHCQSHCYQPLYREQIKEVMQFSGKKLVLSGRLDMLFKLLF